MLLVGCGSEHSPLGPTPSPAPPAAFTGSVTDTVTGAPVAGFTALMAGSRLTVSAPGYVTRETRSSASSVDLIPEAGFDLTFYRQLARDGYEAPALDALRVLSRAPSLYLQRAGLSDAHVATLEQAARAVVPALTGGRFQLMAFESGTEARREAIGWIVAELVNEPGANCARSAVGAAAGHIWLNMIDRCHRDGMPIGGPALLQHELGHSLGFRHVGNPGALMHATTSGVITALERHHAAIAYKRQAGNRDVDIDP